MYLSGVSVRRVEDITEALWGSSVSSSTISDLNKKSYENIEKWRNLPISEEFPYVYLDGISLERSWSGEVRNVSVLVAVGVSRSGYRDVLGVAEGCKEDKDSWGVSIAFLILVDPQSICNFYRRLTVFLIIFSTIIRE